MKYIRLLKTKNNEMLGTITLILILFPLIFQIIFGRKTIFENIKLKFGTICIISFLLQLMFSFICFKIILYKLNKSIESHELVCGMPLVGLFIITLFFTLLLIITMIIQYFIKRSYKK